MPALDNTEEEPNPDGDPKEMLVVTGVARWPGTTGLLWTGILQPDQIEELYRQYHDFILCPGYTNRFGASSDQWGRIFVPGCGECYRETRNIFERWKIKAETDQRWTWWPDHIAKRGYTPITAGEVLRGLPIARWKEYRVLYRKANNVRVVVRRQNHLKAIAAGLGRQQTDQDAAKVLTDLSVSGSSQTGSDPSTPSRSHSDGGGTKACEIDQDE